MTVKNYNEADTYIWHVLVYKCLLFLENFFIQSCKYCPTSSWTKLTAICCDSINNDIIDSY